MTQKSRAKSHEHPTQRALSLPRVSTAHVFMATLPRFVHSVLVLSPRSFAPFLVGLTAVFGCSGEAELFDKTAANTLAAEGTVGDACTLSAPLGEGETVLEDDSACAAPGVCLGYEGDVACSCRCAGEEGDTPLCTCPSGFVCQPDVLVALLPESPGDPVSGGYCLPAP